MRFSVTSTSVALLGPLFLTVMVYTTVSPIVTFVLSTVLLIVKSITGFTVTLVLFVELVEFSFDLTEATFVNVPLVRTLTVTVTLSEVPLAR